MVIGLPPNPLMNLGILDPIRSIGEVILLEVVIILQDIN